MGSEGGFCRCFRRCTSESRMPPPAMQSGRRTRRTLERARSARGGRGWRRQRIAIRLRIPFCAAALRQAPARRGPVWGIRSAILYWTVGLHRYFCFIRRSRTPIGRLPAFVDAIPPGTKYFIFQYLRRLPARRRPLAEIERALRFATMVFSSQLFLFGFMPVFFSLYYLIGNAEKLAHPRREPGILHHRSRKHRTGPARFRRRQSVSRRAHRAGPAPAP